MTIKLCQLVVVWEEIKERKPMEAMTLSLTVEKLPKGFRDKHYKLLNLANFNFYFINSCKIIHARKKYLFIIWESILFKIYFGIRSLSMVSFCMIAYTLQSFINLFFKEIIVPYTLMMVLPKVVWGTLLHNPWQQVEFQEVCQQLG